MTLLDLCDAPEGDDFVARVARHFLARPGQWVDAHDLMPIGGTFAFRTRISDARHRYAMTIENRWRTVTTPDGRRYRVSEYRYVPGGGTAVRVMWTNRHDAECRVVSGPGRWHRCKCGTRWRAIGRYVRRTTRWYRCPAWCELAAGAAVKVVRRRAILGGTDQGWCPDPSLTTPRAKEARRHG